MSTLLYSLGKWTQRFRFAVLAGWLLLLALLGVGAGLFGKGANAPIEISGTESQLALDNLEHTFPQLNGAGATVLFVAPAGSRVDEEPYRESVLGLAEKLRGLPRMHSVSTPFDEHSLSKVSDDGRAAIVSLQIAGEIGSLPLETTTGIREETAAAQKSLPVGASVSYGGDAFSADVPGVTATESLGVVIAFLVLLLTLGTLLAAGMPLFIAILGVGVSIAGLFLVTAFVDLTSTTPMLALMLGLAVGIDYTLFIVSRHQEQLLAGEKMEESIARAVATSGSAVIFAGLTVIIALVGLFVANIGFLTALGMAAAAGVAVAVLVALTLTPALLAMMKLRVLSKRKRRLLAVVDDAAVTSASEVALAAGAEAAQASVQAAESVKARPHSRSKRFFGAWERGVTKHPFVTIVGVIVLLVFAASPALQLRLALPNATSLPADNPARITYELTGKHFGEGYNGQLILTGSIIQSTDPLALMDELKAAVAKVPGVASVPAATPNETADTCILQVIPEEGPHADSTGELVRELRAHTDEWHKKFGVRLAVTGFTAVGIDISDLLLGALIPFGILVVGLSLVLLAMVFRSLWVPVKATLGFLLSVGASFGAVVAVFQWGWLNELLHVESTGPVLSFMPIILMGVLFGLAMDYEVFLVSRMREEYAHGADAKDAVRRGFMGSAKVVTAAALIMFAVFVAFVPEGDPSIKVIAFGLAVGVFVDAFLVRMTLVPAVLALLGKRAWYMPKTLERHLPHFDIEGEGFTRELAYTDWPTDMPDAVIAADELELPQGLYVRHLRLAADQALSLNPLDSRSINFAKVLSGRDRTFSGTLKVRGRLLPERAGSVRRTSAWAVPNTLRAAIADSPELIVLNLSGETMENIELARVRQTIEAAEAVRGTGSKTTSSAETTPDETERPPITWVVIGDPIIAGKAMPVDREFLVPTFGKDTFYPRPGAPLNTWREKK